MSKFSDRTLLKKKTQLLKTISTGKQDARYICSYFKCEFDLKSYEKVYNQINYLNKNNEMLFSGPLPKSYTTIRTVDPLLYSESFKTEFEWCIFTIIQFKQLVFDFLAKKQSFEHAFLIGDYSTALSVLEDINNKIGYSLWAVECNFLVSEFQGGITKNLSYLTELSKEEANLHLLILAQLYSRKSEKNITIAKFNEFFNDILEDVPSSAKNYFNFKFNTKTVVTEDLKYILQVESCSSIIDKYLSLMMVAKSCIMQNLEESPLVVKHLTKFFADFPDENISSILNIHNLRNGTQVFNVSQNKSNDLVDCVELYAVRIPTKSAAYSDASRPAVPVDVGRVFRLKSATP